MLKVLTPLLYYLLSLPMCLLHTPCSPLCALCSMLFAFSSPSALRSVPCAYQNPIEFPPSTGRTIPVIKDDVLETRNNAASATSSVFPSLPKGVLDSTFFLRSGSFSSASVDILVLIKPGAMQFTLIPKRASSTAMALVIPSIADFDAVYAITFGNP